MTKRRLVGPEPVKPMAVARRCGGRTGAAAALALCLSAAGLRGADAVETNRILKAEDIVRIEEALDVLTMALPDTGFEKNVASPRLVLDPVQRILSEPLQVTRLGSEALAVGSSVPAILDQASNWLVVTGAVRAAAVPAIASFTDDLDGSGLPPEWREPLGRFLADLRLSADQIQRATASLDHAERERVLAGYLGDVFRVEDRREAYVALHQAGLSEAALDQAVAEGHELDPGPAAMTFAHAAGKVNLPGLVEAATRLHEATRRLANDMAGMTQWPAAPRDVATAGGRIRIGSPGDDVHRGTAWLVLDPGGDDLYANGPAVANGLAGLPVAVVVDLAGDDRYVAESLGGAGTGILGVGLVLDVGGNDTYRAAYLGQGAGVFGIGLLEDDAGDDTYEGHALVQGAAVVGVGLLQDTGGNDTYRAALYAQGFAGPLGVGWLDEAAGHDVYVAGGRYPDHERHEHRFLSLSQGFAIGWRPMLGGGIAVLADRAGNDVYRADVYGQGVSYWYACGMLIDEAGHDSYEMYEYGQGSGIHLSAGLLYDGAGRDRYSGFSLAQGNAHDFAVGLLVEREGDDLYTADHYAQGRAVNNAFALLLDAAGNDAYFARDGAECQGAGHYNEERGYGSLSLFLDLGGHDVYSAGATDGARLRRPDDGIVFDAGSDALAGTAATAVAEDEKTDTFDPDTATLDELMFHASRYADTDVRKRDKRVAHRALMARGVNALRYLVSGAYQDNDAFTALARELAGSLPDDEVASVLLDRLDDDHMPVRRLAVYLLGDLDTAEHAPRVRALLADEDIAGAAVRTLGKWRDRDAVSDLLPLLRHPKERRRIVAAMALGEIGDERAAGPLVAALGDPVFTVRHAALRALDGLPAVSVETALRAAWPDAAGFQQRLIRQRLGLGKSAASMPAP